MKCPLCNIEMAIQATRHKLAGDKTPDVETRLYIEQDFTCRNKKCSNYGKMVYTNKNPIQLSKD
ncbi:MAG: hypothetical protein UFG06_14010 [Lachnospiraceae bacterium]|nr:hypothetical protein [Lachnospiraceae bacterium]